MPIADLDTAYDEIFGRFTTDWNALTPAITGGSAPDIFYQQVPVVGSQPSNEPWCFIAITHNIGEQAALGPATSGLRRYDRAGIVTVRVHVPVAQRVLLRSLVPVAQKAFQGKTTTGAIWFRNVRVNEIGAEGPYLRMDVIAEFEYESFE